MTTGDNSDNIQLNEVRWLIDILDGKPVVNPNSGERDEGGRQLAAIWRELTCNDPLADNGEDGHSDARGRRRDRNVELINVHPYGM